ncbi:MAG: prepilin-type N-terminal cleavage/methylation domain-containing protein [Acidobacteriota bacterium]
MEAVSGRPSRGTSLVELMIVLALIGVMALLAADLVTHSLTLLGAVGRSVRNPLVSHVVARLRSDIENAAGVRSAAFAWSKQPLELRGQDGSIVRLELEGDRLMRRTEDGGGVEGEAQVLLRGVTAWWWRSPVPGVVDLRIGYLVHPETERQITSGTVGAGRVRRTENLRFALRAGGGGWRW